MKLGLKSKIFGHITLKKHMLGRYDIRENL